MNLTTAVVGLGNIGGPVAVTIAACNRGVVGVDGDRSRREDWAERTGAPVAASLDDVDCTGLERVFVVVRTTTQALAVLADLRRLTSSRPGDPLAVHLFTTLEPGAAERLGDPGDGAMSHGAVRVLEQPVSGGAAGAAAGTLTVLSAGPLTEADTEFLLATVAARVIPLAGYGVPTLVKLINNTLAALNTRSTAVMVLLASRLGLDPGQVKEIVDTSSGASSMGAMIDHFADDQALLLTKDVALLAGVIDELPVIDLDGDAFLADLRAARAVLTSTDRTVGDPE